ncbi:hypothetical protein C8J57DRAFT_179230 [Mycena rebaudengoi]|nr:hypothetical protein C8J57DRAFT_179230 [Mycena rebaudengoi]
MPSRIDSSHAGHHQPHTRYRRLMLPQCARLLKEGPGRRPRLAGLPVCIEFAAVLLAISTLPTTRAIVCRGYFDSRCRRSCWGHRRRRRGVTWQRTQNVDPPPRFGQRRRRYRVRRCPGQRSLEISTISRVLNRSSSAVNSTIGAVVGVRGCGGDGGEGLGLGPITSSLGCGLAVVVVAIAVTAVYGGLSLAPIRPTGALERCTDAFSTRNTSLSIPRTVRLCLRGWVWEVDGEIVILSSHAIQRCNAVIRASLGHPSTSPYLPTAHPPPPATHCAVVFGRRAVCGALHPAPCVQCRSSRTSPSDIRLPPFSSKDLSPSVASRSSLVAVPARSGAVRRLPRPQPPAAQNPPTPSSPVPWLSAHPPQPVTRSRTVQRRRCRPLSMTRVVFSADSPPPHPPSSSHPPALLRRRRRPPSISHHPSALRPRIPLPSLGAARPPILPLLGNSSFAGHYYLSTAFIPCCISRFLLHCRHSRQDRLRRRHSPWEMEMARLDVLLLPPLPLISVLPSSSSRTLADCRIRDLDARAGVGIRAGGIWG